MKRVGIIGGTFDPIHLAHLNIAKIAKDRLNLEKIIFIPAGSQPLKLDKKVTKASLRLNMVKTAIEGKDGFEVSDYEIQKQGISFTYETLEHFKKEDEQLYFITHFPGNVNDIFEIIQKNEINFYNFQLCRAFSSLCKASFRVLRWQAYTRCSIQILTDSAAHPSAYGHR